jgi:hypothetical protein
LPGTRIAPDRVAGYYIDLRLKAHVAQWPPSWLERPQLPHVAVCQWGLGAYEHYIAGDGERWLTAAIDAGRYLIDSQTCGDSQDGGWRHDFPTTHTFQLVPPWLSGMAQGQGASLLTRLYLETKEDQFAEAALRALRPLSVPTEEGGVNARLDGGSFAEEYPTHPPSFVLNGAFFALWGLSQPLSMGHRLLVAVRPLSSSSRQRRELRVSPPP